MSKKTLNDTTDAIVTTDVPTTLPPSTPDEPRAFPPPETSVYDVTNTVLKPIAYALDSDLNRTGIVDTDILNDNAKSLTLQYGFGALFSTSQGFNGLPPDRLDFNTFMNLITSVSAQQQRGVQFTFNSKVAVYLQYGNTPPSPPQYGYYPFNSVLFDPNTNAYFKKISTSLDTLPQAGVPFNFSAYPNNWTQITNITTPQLVQQGRLNGVGIQNSNTAPYDDTQGSQTLYFTPTEEGNLISIYDATNNNWVTQTFDEINLAVNTLSDGNYDIFVADNIPIPPPLARITYTPTNIVVLDTITFTDASTPSSTSRAWSVTGIGVTSADYTLSSSTAQKTTIIFRSVTKQFTVNMLPYRANTTYTPSPATAVITPAYIQGTSAIRYITPIIQSLPTTFTDISLPTSDSRVWTVTGTGVTSADYSITYPATDPFSAIITFINVKTYNVNMQPTQALTQYTPPTFTSPNITPTAEATGVAYYTSPTPPVYIGFGYTFTDACNPPSDSRTWTVTGTGIMPSDYTITINPLTPTIATITFNRVTTFRVNMFPVKTGETYIPNPYYVDFQALSNIGTASFTNPGSQLVLYDNWAFVDSSTPTPTSWLWTLVPADTPIIGSTTSVADISFGTPNTQYTLYMRPQRTGIVYSPLVAQFSFVTGGAVGVPFVYSIAEYPTVGLPFALYDAGYPNGTTRTWEVIQGSCTLSSTTDYQITVTANDQSQACRIRMTPHIDNFNFNPSFEDYVIGAINPRQPNTGTAIIQYTQSNPAPIGTILTFRDMSTPAPDSRLWLINGEGVQPNDYQLVNGTSGTDQTIQVILLTDNTFNINLLCIKANYDYIPQVKTLILPTIQPTSNNFGVTPLQLVAVPWGVSNPSNRVIQNGRWVNALPLTNPNVPALQGLLLGSINVVDGAVQSWTATRSIWNLYNQVNKSLFCRILVGWQVRGDATSIVNMNSNITPGEGNFSFLLDPLYVRDFIFNYNSTHYPNPPSQINFGYITLTYNASFRINQNTGVTVQASNTISFTSFNIQSGQVLNQQQGCQVNFIAVVPNTVSTPTGFRYGINVIQKTESGSYAPPNPSLVGVNIGCAENTNGLVTEFWC